MTLSFSSLSGGTSFTIITSTGGSKTATLSKTFPAGTYLIESMAADTNLEIYLGASDGTQVGSCVAGAKSVTASASFLYVTTVNADTNDAVTFTLKSAATLATKTDAVWAPPTITDITPSGLPNVNDTTTITGTNFASNVEVKFRKSDDSTLVSPKTTVRGSATSIIAGRPDSFAVGDAPYDVIVTNPSTTLSATSLNAITSGAVPVWVTSSTLDAAQIGTAFSQTIQATDADGGSSIIYAIVSGSLQTGLSLNTSTGAITGTPTGSAGSTTIVISATDSGGNAVSRTFTQNITAPLTVNYLVVAGGGGGGSYTGSGGGGAGGLRSTVTATGGGGSLESPLELENNTMYTVTVGAGGRGAYGAIQSASGSNSVFSTITSTGGGRGGGYVQGTTFYPPSTGGSGGGGNYSGSALGAAATSSPVQGYAGGNGQAGNDAGGGGGGAGAVGGNGTSAGNGGNGGNGVAVSITGSSVTYAGGGGGGKFNTGSAGTGGAGGGGAGSRDNSGSSAAHGTATLGGGGGGHGTTSIPAEFFGGNGGSGIVVIQYAGTIQKARGGVVTTSGGNTIHTFTSSGTFYTGMGTAKATGGDIYTDGTYWYHAFRSSGTFTPTSSYSADILVVAGGGGGSGFGGGGGGAGGLVYGTRSLTATGYTITVGNGGACAVNNGQNGSNGANSVFDTSGTAWTANGGGGGVHVGGSGGTGGSGGGGGYNSSSGGSANQSSPSGATGYGNAGGGNTGVGAPTYAAGGGGGAGAVGGTQNGSANSAAGGIGRQYQGFADTTGTGDQGYYAGGGGGSAATFVGSAGGLGGGGFGVYYPAWNPGENGKAFTGGGGGGGGNTVRTAGNGGSGVVIIRYSV